MATFIIMRLTFREAVRRKIVLAALLLGVAFLIFYSVGFYFIVTNIKQAPGAAAILAQAEAYNFLFMAGMYAVTFLAVVMAALISADTLAGEINSGTIQTLVTKPVPRAEIVLGKWLGFAGLLALYLALMAGGVTVSVWLQSHYLADNWLAGVGLIYLESLIIARRIELGDDSTNSVSARLVERASLQVVGPAGGLDDDQAGEARDPTLHLT